LTYFWPNSNCLYVQDMLWVLYHPAKQCVSSMSTHSLGVSIFRLLKWETATFISSGLWLQHPNLNLINYTIYIEIQQRGHFRKTHNMNRQTLRYGWHSFQQRIINDATNGWCKHLLANLSLYVRLQQHRKRFVNRRCTDSIFLVNRTACGDHTQVHVTYSIISLTGLMSPRTCIDIPSQSRLRLSGTASMLLSVILSVWTLSKLLLRHTFLIVLTHHAIDSNPLSTLIHFQWHTAPTKEMHIVLYCSDGFSTFDLSFAS